eukprot:7693292-Heterocapsa_arctica.AAC.1
MYWQAEQDTVPPINLINPIGFDHDLVNNECQCEELIPHIGIDIITGEGGGWRRVLLENSKEINFIAVCLSEAYHLAQARR